MKVFASWSGGKECALATYRAISQGYEVSCLLNFISEDGTRSRSHGIKAYLLASQAEALGIPILQVKTSWKDYERNFKNTVMELKKRGVEGGVFGDMDLEEHKEWIERVCGELGIEPIFPLWGIESENLLYELLNSGFKAMVVATRLEGFLGKKLDDAFFGGMRNTGSHPCGENGEYHTFVFDGPIFKKPLYVIPGREEKRGNVWFLDISVQRNDR